ncbi:MAG: hypothetical protein JW927_09850 [Deltaproteobacteria bacterium]|nr:hypothetical protein [Deltaproteobacteria bacterium]
MPKQGNINGANMPKNIEKETPVLSFVIGTIWYPPKRIIIDNIINIPVIRMVGLLLLQL